MKVASTFFGRPMTRLIFCTSPDADIRAAAGLRIGEALGIDIKDISPDCSGPVPTENSVRPIVPTENLLWPQKRTMLHALPSQALTSIWMSLILKLFASDIIFANHKMPAEEARTGSRTGASEATTPQRNVGGGLT